MPPILVWIYALALTFDYFLTEIHCQELTGFNEAVLIGNYGSMGPPKNKMMRRLSAATKTIGMAARSMGGRSMGRGMEENGTSEIDPNTLMVLYDGKTCPYKVIVQGFEALMEGQNQIKSRSAGGKGGSALTECMSKLASCVTLAVSDVQCYSQCMMDKSPTLRKVRTILPQKIKSFCDTVGTVFDKIIGRLETKLPEITKLQHFMKLFDTTIEHYKSYARLAAKALSSQIMNHIKKPLLADNRRCLRPIARSLGLADPNLRNHNTMFNEACKNISFLNPAKEIIGLLTKKPHMADIMLSGHHLAKIIAKHVPGPHQPMFSAFHDVVNLATGTSCGMIQYAETGEKIECENKDNADEPQPKSILLPPQYKDPDPFKGACGTIPEFPSFDLNMGFKFPKMDKE